jgi:tetratricopeptide (TPR) repeat protein
MTLTPKLLLAIFVALMFCQASAHASEADSINAALTGKPHSGGYNPHGNLAPEQLIHVALRHMHEGRPNEALNELDRGVMQHPDNGELLSVRGSLLLQLGRISDALRDFEAALAIDPDDAETLINRSQAYRQFGRIQEALTDLDHALAFNPDLVAAHFNRGSIYYSSSEFHKALEDFKACIAIDPHDPAPYFNRASTHYALGDRTDAIEDMQHFLELADQSEWKKTAEALIEQWRAEVSKPRSQAPNS